MCGYTTVLESQALRSTRFYLRLYELTEHGCRPVDAATLAGAIFAISRVSTTPRSALPGMRKSSALQLCNSPTAHLRTIQYHTVGPSWLQRRPSSQRRSSGEGEEGERLASFPLRRAGRRE